jgi:hypothetical protein
MIYDTKTLRRLLYTLVMRSYYTIIRFPIFIWVLLDKAAFCDKCHKPVCTFLECVDKKCYCLDCSQNEKI